MISRMCYLTRTNTSQMTRYNTFQNCNSSSAPERVAIIGAGLIGRGWAIVFARATWQVSVYDANPSALNDSRTAIAEQLRMLDELGLCTRPEDILQRIKYESDLSAAVNNARYVQECGPENLDTKKALLSELDGLLPSHAILASSTSGFMASELSGHLQGKHRVLVVHPVNPPHLVPLVEIAPAESTDPFIVDATRELMIALNQTPITVQKEIPGFVLNRLQGALLNEAMHLVEEGIATPEDIDKTVRDGLGLRWSFMGPFETIDLNAPAGLADYAYRYGKMYREMAQSWATPPGWKENPIERLEQSRRTALKRDDIAARQNWRDYRLAALIFHKRQQEN